jgi:hypothetical protein
VKTITGMPGRIAASTEPGSGNPGDLRDLERPDENVAASTELDFRDLWPECRRSDAGPDAMMF